jgi:hypothetical protein
MHASQNSESVSVLTWSIAVYTCVSKCRLTTFSHSNKFWISFSSFPARIFTTLDRGFDAPLLANYSVSLILNLAIITLALKLRRPVKKDKKTEWKWNWRRVACPQKQSRDASVLCVYFFVQLLCQQRIHFSKRAAIYMRVYTVSFVYDCYFLLFFTHVSCVSRIQFLPYTARRALNSFFMIDVTNVIKRCFVVEALGSFPCRDKITKNIVAISSYILRGVGYVEFLF